MAEPVDLSAMHAAVAGLGVENVKTVAAYPAAMMAMDLGNKVASAQRVNGYLETALSNNVKLAQEVDPIQAVSTVKALTSDSVAEKILNLVAAISGGQVGLKGGQSTPPETAVPGTVISGKLVPA